MSNFFILGFVDFYSISANIMDFNPNNWSANFNKIITSKNVQKNIKKHK